MQQNISPPELLGKEAAGSQQGELFVSELCEDFCQKNNLTTHLLMHVGGKKISCEICNKKFSDSSKLRQHFLIHTGEKCFACEICSRNSLERAL